jgi:LPXTG-motif cell wall-anchored protein
MSSPAGSTSGTSGASTADQSAQSTDQTGNAQTANKRLPQTASPLPLVGLFGVGLLALGSLLRKRKAHV